MLTSTAGDFTIGRENKITTMKENETTPSNSTHTLTLSHTLIATLFHTLACFSLAHYLLFSGTLFAHYF